MPSEEKTAALVSVVVPCFNEQEVIERLYREMRPILASLDVPHEILFVNDGSTDDTASILREISRNDPRVRIVEFSRNFGHQAALTAGYDLARGDVVITLDADLQHPPRLIPEMIAKWRAGADVVCGVRQASADERWTKKVTSRIFYWLFHALADVDLPGSAPDFRLMDRRAVEALRSMRERSRFLRGMCHWVGFSAETVSYEEGDRAAGEAKYSPVKMLRLAYRGILSFSRAPLHVIMVLGAVLSLLSFAYGVYSIIEKVVFGTTVAGWTSIIVVLTFLSGIQLLSFGLIGEYVGQIYEEVKQRPLYIVRREIGVPSAAEPPRGPNAASSAPRSGNGSQPC